MNKKIIIVGSIVTFMVIATLALGAYRLNFTNRDISKSNGSNDLVKYNDVQNRSPQEDQLPSDTPSGGQVDDSGVGRRSAPETGGSGPEVKIKAEIFTGTLEKVDTGCFADGECFVEVGGKHVTALLGWNNETVGTIEGVDSFGDLSSHIGEMVEVYAKDNLDGTYTLYGSDGFYIKLSKSTGTTPPKEAAVGGCVVGGCSGQLCTDATNEPVASTCEYRPEYSCYQNATCERQVNGECGWTETTELSQCLAVNGGQPTVQVQ